MSTLNIMHLTQTVVRGSGFEGLILRLAEKIDKSRFNMSIVSLTTPTPIAFSFLKMAEQVCPQTDYIPWKRTKPFFSSIYKLCRLIKKHNVHILHTHEPRTNFVGLIAARLTGIKVIASAHGWIFFGVPFWLKFYQQIDRQVVRFHDHIHVGSMFLRKELGHKKIPLERITTIHYSLNRKNLASYSYDIDYLRKRYRLNSHYKLIATVARLSREKGHKFLLQAAQEVVREVPNVKFLIVGEGPIREELENYCAELGISEHIIFTGFCPNVVEILHSIDIMVLPSLTESFPHVILEAMSVGKPVIATDVGGVSEMIRHGETGLLIKPSDSEAMAESIILLLRNQAMRNKMGQNAQKRIELEFTLEHYIKQMQDLYIRVSSEK
ncbi:MAG: glycosyltransferase family 4 protein [Planctomycetota bacterium]|jgi:glycosyltransferase involved in cell wall biosynthesis